MYSYQLKFKDTTIPGYMMDENGEIYSFHSNKVLKPFGNKEHRPVVCVLHNGRKIMYRLDYLVISTLKSFYDDIIRITHIDGNEFNCSLDNLLIVRKSDIIDKYKKMYNIENLEEIPEEWKCYSIADNIEVSNFGEVREFITKAPISTKNEHGYKRFDRNGTHYLVHRLVAELFVENPNPDKFTFVNHIDGNKSNNIFYNLEWCNLSMNGEHAFLTGLSKSYDDKTIRHVCELLEQGLPHVIIEQITGINRKYISDIYRGRRLKNISSEYNFTKKIPLKELYNHDLIIALINAGYPPKETAELLKVEYTPSFVSYYEKLQKENKSK